MNPDRAVVGYVKFSNGLLTTVASAVANFREPNEPVGGSKRSKRSRTRKDPENVRMLKHCAGCHLRLGHAANKKVNLGT